VAVATQQDVAVVTQEAVAVVTREAVAVAMQQAAAFAVQQAVALAAQDPAAAAVTHEQDVAEATHGAVARAADRVARVMPVRSHASRPAERSKHSASHGCGRCPGGRDRHDRTLITRRVLIPRTETRRRPARHAWHRATAVGTMPRRGSARSVCAGRARGAHDGARHVVRPTRQ
jgi:hypothetical protein